MFATSIPPLRPKSKTINSLDSRVVTHPTTSRPTTGLDFTRSDGIECFPVSWPIAKLRSWLIEYILFCDCPLRLVFPRPSAPTTPRQLASIESLSYGCYSVKPRERFPAFTAALIAPVVLCLLRWSTERAPLAWLCGKQFSGLREANDTLSPLQQPENVVLPQALRRTDKNLRVTVLPQECRLHALVVRASSHHDCNMEHLM